MRPMIVVADEVAPYLISANEFSFTIKYRCIDKGFTDVRITMWFVEDFDMEFSYKKACTRPKAFVAREGYSVGNLIFGGLML
jgi:hypothetical protein